MYQLLKRISPHYRVRLLSFLEHEDERAFLPELEALCESVHVMRRLPPPRWQLFPYEPFDEFRTPQMEAAVSHCLGDYDFSLMQLEYTQMACYADPEYRHTDAADQARGGFRGLCAPGAHRDEADAEGPLVLQLPAGPRPRNTTPPPRERRDLHDRAGCRGNCERFCADVPVHVISTGVDLDFFAPPEAAATAPRLVFVGAFQHLPNVDAMVYFCRSIFPRYPG